MNLKVGHISYLNCVPFFHFLREAGFTGEIVQGVPAQLNAMLADGQIDLSPSSSFEYGLHWQQYVLLPGLSISSCGPVQSVLLFSPVPLEELGGKSIALTGESATSVNLLKVLLWEFVGVRGTEFRVPEESVEECISKGQPALLIGDRALRMAQERIEGCRIYDLGALWHQYTGLPFVFALWIVRRESIITKKKQIEVLLSQLEKSLEWARENFQQLAGTRPEGSWLGQKEVMDYWDQMSFDLAEEHLAGLDLYFRLCCKHKLLTENPDVEFFSR